jgi:hypothetical protein
VSWTLVPEYPPNAAFGACFKCRAARRQHEGERLLDPMLDTFDLGPDLVPGQNDGHIIFCETCITEAARLLGMVTPLEAAKLTEQLADATKEIEDLRRWAEATEKALDAVTKQQAMKAAK